MQLSGQTRFQLIDEDGDDLPGQWEFAWEGRDPFEVVIAAVTEVSGRPWKWSVRHTHSGRLSPQRCRILSTRVGNVLRKENRKRLCDCITRVIAEEFVGHRRRKMDTEAVMAVLATVDPETPEDLEIPPEVTTAIMLRKFRQALKAAVECDGGLKVNWQIE
jgi:hypothetical protein